MGFIISLYVTVFSLIITVVRKLHLTIPAIFFLITATVAPRPEVPYWIRVTIGILFLASVGIWCLYWIYIILATIFEFFAVAFAAVKKPKPPKLEEYDAVYQVRCVKAQGRSLKGMSFDRNENLIDSKTGKPVEI